MAKATGKNPADYIVPLSMNGLDGRMLRLPAPKGKTRNILFVYGHHASIEQQFAAAQALNRYGSVTLPDLPGFGGMTAFYKIDRKPSIDNLADYLAAFVKMHYKRRKVTIVAMSLGFAITTRMLQRCPELVGKIDTLVSYQGFVHHEEFLFNRKNRLLMRYGASVFSNRLPAFLGDKLALRPSLIRATYKIADKTANISGDEERVQRINHEIHLWKTNDLRTYMDTTVSMLRLNLLNERVELPLYHVGVASDRYFDNHVVEQHLNIIYPKVTVIPSNLSKYGSITDSKSFIPPKLKKILANQP